MLVKDKSITHGYLLGLEFQSEDMEALASFYLLRSTVKSEGTNSPEI